tara:strand:+ start:2449 stop:2697 length:249 start_codon:yes stop_codon:yes gene_type:complete
MNKYRKEYCKENGSVKINPENTKLYDYIKHLENKLEQAEQLTLTDVSQQSELFFALLEWIDYGDNENKKYIVESFLKDINSK